MSTPQDQNGRVKELLQLWCDERLSRGQSDELAKLLGTSETARRAYVEMVQLCVALADWSQLAEAEVPATSDLSAGSARNGHPVAASTALPAADEPRPSSPKGDVARTAASTVRGRRGSPWLALAVAATLLISVAFWGWSRMGDPHGGDIAAADNRAGRVAVDSQLANEEEVYADGIFIARVVELTPDAEWDEDLRPREFFMRLRAGEQIQLRSGLAHVEFYSGAHVILHGPSTFTLTGPAAGKLESGRLTGKVDDGNFLLTTPTAKVVDLGTEFGVNVGPLSNTDVWVFDGEVEVQPGIAGLEARKPKARAHHLTEGMSVRVAATGQVSDGQQAGIESKLFTRSFPLPSDTDATELDLVDIICGGNGRGLRLAATIDPLTGEWDRRVFDNSVLKGTRHGDHTYHASTWHPFMDGTFIPNQFGEPFQVDSLGGRIRMGTGRGDYTWGPLWARRVVKDSSQIDASPDPWGAMTLPVIIERLSRCRLGGLGIHSSVGITLDLQAIGQQHFGLVERLRGVLTNLDNSKEHNPEWAAENPRPSADFHVYVDGELRYQQLDFARNVEGVSFEVELTPNDRFLTFVTTDGGDSNKYDHIVVIDPVLVVRDADHDKLSALWQRLNSPATQNSGTTVIHQRPTR